MDRLVGQEEAEQSVWKVRYAFYAVAVVFVAPWAVGLAVGLLAGIVNIWVPLPFPRPSYFILVICTISTILSFSAVMFVVKSKYRSTLDSIGIVKDRFAVNALIGFAAAFLIMPCSAVLAAATVKVTGLVAPSNWFVTTAAAVQSNWEAASLLVAGCVLVPLTEEVCMRGLLYNALKRRCTAPVAAVLTSAVFAALHFNPAGFLGLFAMSAGFIMLYERTGSLVTPIFAHFAINALILVSSLST
jgi:membrane protease YdiL (CAAX protease family)